MKRILLFLILILFPLSVLGLELPELHSKNVLLYDIENQEILYEKGSDEVINIASLTKIMTTIVAIENIDDLDDTVIITKDILDEIPSDASVADLKLGDKVTYLDLLYASILPSGADATTALAHGICGSTAKFIALMNDKAQELGLENTVFSNVTGYDIENHHSTPKEILEILNYALSNPLFKKIYETKEYTLTNGLKVESTLNMYNHNNKYDLTNILGSKTGYTSKAGQCMSSIIKVTDKELILLTFGAKRINWGDAFNIDDAFTVMNYLNSNYKNYTIYKKDEVLKTIPVSNSNINEYKIKVNKDVVVYTDSLNKDDIKFTYDGLESLDYHNKKGDKIGVVTYTYQNQVFSDEIYLKENINFSLLRYLQNHFNIILIILFVVIFIYYLNNKKKIKRKFRKLKRLFN